MTTTETQRPARLDDLLMVETRLSGMGKVRMSLIQTITRCKYTSCRELSPYNRSNTNSSC